ncbi:17571_t:CDS:2 [Racocetra fulgida]|uniref:17571_t:CDS:1 n=1 Tax=Racocetra fulgida TaxID=60492 RepID=A0A9N9IZL0_9GLOM|nr:17571_t:CDS:2 [Racocetra fulgida]
MGFYNSKINKNQFPSLNIKEFKSTSSNVLNESHESISDTGNSYFEKGRRYTTQNKIYSLPNDHEEHSRLNLQHIVLRLVWNDNFFAPVEHLLNQEDTKVLDVGYSKAKFIGVDISLVQPGLDKPKNVEFMEGNVLERLPFDDNTFDYVFQRLLIIAIPAKEWPSVINELVRVLKPGGYLERGIDPHTCYKLQGYLKEHNQLCNIHCEIKENLNVDKKIRELRIKNYSGALMGIKPKLMTIINVSSVEYDDLVKTVEKELCEFDCYNPHARAYAQKKISLKLGA